MRKASIMPGDVSCLRQIGHQKKPRFQLDALQPLATGIDQFRLAIFVGCAINRLEKFSRNASAL
jgi:hypothetical protein